MELFRYFLRNRQKFPGIDGISTFNEVRYAPVPESIFSCPHAASLRQAFAHCAIFPTAASRRSLDRVSVPVWLIILSDQLSVLALVGRYPANKLMDRGLIPWREASEEGLRFSHCTLVLWSHPVLARVSPSYPEP